MAEGKSGAETVSSSPEKHLAFQVAVKEKGVEKAFKEFGGSKDGVKAWQVAAINSGKNLFRLEAEISSFTHQGFAFHHADRRFISTHVQNRLASLTQGLNTADYNLFNETTEQELTQLEQTYVSVRPGLEEKLPLYAKIAEAVVKVAIDEENSAIHEGRFDYRFNILTNIIPLVNQLHEVAEPA
jgi:hypothetical protein